MHNNEIVYAIHDFVAENDDEIAFHAGESIVVLEKDEKYMDGWWQVSCYSSFNKYRIAY